MMSSKNKSKIPVEEQLRMIWAEIVSIIERLRKLEAGG